MENQKEEKLYFEQEEELNLDNLENEEVSGEQDILKALKEEGNLFWKKGNVNAAIECWKNALKTCLKYSVRGISRRNLIDMQIAIRMNLSLAFLKKEEYNSAIENLEFPLNDNPDNMKALFRKATALLGLQDWEAATSVCKKMLELDKNNKDAEIILKKIEAQKLKYKDQEKKLFSNMFGKSKVLKKHNSAVLKVNQEPKGEEELLDNADKDDEGKAFECKLCAKIWNVVWMKEDFDKSIWNEKSTTYRIENICNLTMRRDLPLTILYSVYRLYALHYYLYVKSNPNDADVHKNPFNKDTFSSSASVSLNSSVSTFFSFFPPITSEETQIQCSYETLPNLNQKENLVIHCIGTTQNNKMQCKYTHILNRVPAIKNLIIIFIGLFDQKFNGKENELSEPMTVSLKSGQTQVALLFKGNYNTFLNKYTGILTNKSHTFHPDFIVFINPNFYYNFETWKDILINLINANHICIVIENSCGASLSDMSNVIKSKIEMMSGSVLLNLQDNPFKVIYDKNELTHVNDNNDNDTDGERRRLIEDKEKEKMDCNVLVKNSVFMVFKGKDQKEE